MLARPEFLQHIALEILNEPESSTPAFFLSGLSWGSASLRIASMLLQMYIQICSHTQMLLSLALSLTLTRALSLSLSLLLACLLACLGYGNRKSRGPEA